MSIKKIAYEKYKLDWMLHRGYTLGELISVLSSYANDIDEDLVTALDIWESDRGFGGEIWACFDEFIDSEYQEKDYMKQLLNEEEYKEYQEDLNMNNRVNAIAAFAQRREDEAVAKEKALQQQVESYIKQIRELKPRIDELLTVGNACLKHNIPLTGQAWGGHEGYDTHQFFTNCWSHLVGFVHNKDNSITHLGIFAGGACGSYDFYTDGFEVYDRCGKTGEIVTPNVWHLKRFVAEFDKFENELYKYVDKVCKSK